MNAQDDETNILNSYAQAKGQLPLLNTPATGGQSLTGYRTPELASEARAYVESLESIPDNDPDKLDEGWDGVGTAPSDKLRRGLLEILTESFLHNTYPEWLGDATDDANACLDMIQAIHHVKEYGWASVYEMVKSEEAPPSFMLPPVVAHLFPFKDDDDDE